MTVSTPDEKIVSHLCIVRNFSGTQGERIEERTLCDINGRPLSPDVASKFDIPHIQYVGVVSIINAVPGPMGMTGIPADARFPIDASTPGEALSKFEECVRALDEEIQRKQQETFEKMQQQENESKLIVPDAMESEAINNSMNISG